MIDTKPRPDAASAALADQPAGLDPQGQPARQVERWLLAGILALAAVLNFFGLQKEGYGNEYYAAAVRSMLESWHNFFFASFDPGGFVTIDKPPLGFWLQAAAAKLLGFHGWTLMLPQALAGVASVALLYTLVRRAFGPLAGLLAALTLALTPIAVVVFRNNIIDGTLVLFMLLAVWAMSRAVSAGSVRWLLASAVILGLAFNVKMAEAYLALPALWLTYLVAARSPIPARVGHLALATLALLAVSLSWAVAVDATPTDARPFIGSTTDNSELQLITQYNGLDRLLPRRLLFRGSAEGRPVTPRAEANGAVRGTQTTAGQAAVSPGAGFNGTAGETGAPGPLRLLNAQLGGQIGWLLPLALAGLLFAAWRSGWRGPLGAEQAGLLLWGA
ncbi:MAG TPA: glycosyltransferase family 39 protein, partial [Chloroflexota bacterium]|nr:glycosyltransferase family 39 protein [Chloroflexota bacterium]